LIDLELLTKRDLWEAYYKALDDENDDLIDAIEKEITFRYGTWFSPF